MNNFVEMSTEELMNADGGLVITGTMVCAAIGCVASGVAVGYAIGTIAEKIF